MPTSKQRVRPNLVELESRETPTIWVSDIRWVDEPGTLPRAIRIANETPGKDTISFSFAGLGGNNIVFNSTKTLDVLDEVTIQLGWNVGDGKSVTIGGVKPLVFTHKTFFDSLPVPEPGVPPPTPTSAVIGINFVNCKADGNGGAIEVSGGDLTLTSCYFEGNTAGVQGGAVMVGAPCGLTVSNSNFVQNTASYGGAIGSAGRVVLTGAVFGENRAVIQPALAAAALIAGPAAAINAGNGGAVFSTGVLTSDGSLFTYNAATAAGAGVYIAHPSKAVENASTITGGRFEHNRVTTTAAAGGALAGDGGGVCVASGFVRVNGDVTFYSNGAGSGGGLSAGANATVEIKTAKFEYNETPQVNGQYQGRAINVAAGASVSVQGSTFDHNGIRGTYTNNGGNTFLDSPDE